MADAIPDETGPSTVARDSLTIGIWTTVTRITGLARIVVTAAVFGPTFLANIYQSTNLIPNLLNQLLAGPLIIAVLIPPLVRLIEADDRPAARRFANASLGMVVIGFLTAGFLAIAAGPIIVRMLTLGVGDDLRGDAQSTAWVLLLLLVPQVVLYGLIAVATAVQQSRGRFAMPAAALSLENLGIVAVTLAVARIHGSGFEVDEVSDGLLLLLGGGTTAAVATHALVQWIGAYRSGFALLPTAGWRDREVIAVLKLALASLGSASSGVALFWATITIAGLTPGGVVALQTGRQFADFSAAIGSRPIGTALLPRLARLRAAGSARFNEEYVAALAVALFLSIPAAFGLAAISEQLARAAAFGTMATPEGINLLHVGILGASAGIIPGAVLEVGRQGAYSARNARLIFQTTMIRAVLNIPALVIAALSGGTTMILILGLKSGVVDAVANGYLDRRVRSGGQSTHTLRRRVPRQVGAAMLAAVGAWLVASGLGTETSSRVVSWLAVLAASAAGFGIYMAIVLRYEAGDLAEFGFRVPAWLNRAA